jgi:hypothetical protein
MNQNAMEVARRWASRLGGSMESIRSGVQAVTVAPTERAARQQDAYLAGIQRAVTDGKYAAGLRRVTLADWQNAMLNKGLSRIGSGATAAIPKVESFMQEFLPHVAAGQAKLESMPRGDINQNVQRAIAMIMHNASFRRRS